MTRTIARIALSTPVQFITAFVPLWFLGGGGLHRRFPMTTPQIQWPAIELDDWQDANTCPECDGAGDIPGLREGDDDLMCPVCEGTGEV